RTLKRLIQKRPFVLWVVVDLPLRNEEPQPRQKIDTRGRLLHTAYLHTSETLCRRTNFFYMIYTGFSCGSQEAVVWGSSAQHPAMPERVMFNRVGMSAGQYSKNK
ncbi:unnamed protein product, partial [Ectocarpus sp. 12 AP-2014]